MKKCVNKWGNKEIEQVKNYTYLGVPLHLSFQLTGGGDKVTAT